MKIAFPWYRLYLTVWLHYLRKLKYRKNIPPTKKKPGFFVKKKANYLGTLRKINMAGEWNYKNLYITFSQKNRK